MSFFKMIDCHCHLEQKDYNEDRDEVIEKCRKQLRALVTSCVHPNDMKLTLDIAKKHNGFVFCTIGIHPEYIKEISEKEIDKAIEEIKKNKENIVAIGETGLDYFWIKEAKLREKQKALFRKLIKVAKELNMPMVIHNRDASEDTIKILEEEGMKGKKVLMHMFNDRKFLNKIIENGWFISIGPGIKKSKDIGKIARDMPLNKIMLETDSPWFGNGERGTPLNVRVAAEKIAEIKKIPLEEVERQTDLNAINFFGLRFF